MFSLVRDLNEVSRVVAHEVKMVLCLPPEVVISHPYHHHYHHHHHCRHHHHHCHHYLETEKRSPIRDSRCLSGVDQRVKVPGHVSVNLRDALLSEKCNFFEHCSKGL